MNFLNSKNMRPGKRRDIGLCFFEMKKRNEFPNKIQKKYYWTDYVVYPIKNLKFSLKLRGWFEVEDMMSHSRIRVGKIPG